jgi:hypothetical protein
MWDYLQYASGFAQLGHDVYYHEDTWSWPYHPLEERPSDDGTYSASALSNYAERHAPELRNRWHYRHLAATSFGMSAEAFREIAESADLLVNVSGACSLPPHLSSRCRTVFLDTDPGYNQVVLSEEFELPGDPHRWCNAVAAHDVHFTYAENINEPDCLVPHAGLSWHTTRMPIVLDSWRPLRDVVPTSGAPWTTVMTWNAFDRPLMYKGQELGSKDREFEKILNLPHAVTVPLKVALGGKNAPLQRVAAHGWEVVSAPRATLSAFDYQHFLRTSRAEISCAKHVYVALRTGWFSCRSACYLAAGRPVVVQDTGLSRTLPIGVGLLTFESADQAAAAIAAVEADYDKHRLAAAELAGEYFDHRTVLPRLLDDVFSVTRIG